VGKGEDAMIEPLLSEDALVADIARSDARALHLWWLGQSGYVVAHGGTRVLFDPYLSDSLTRKYEATDNPHVRMSRQVVSPAKLAGIDVVTSTHAHTDHMDAETLNAVFATNPNAAFAYARATRATAQQRIAAFASIESTGLSSGERWGGRGVTIHAVPASHKPAGKDDAGDDPCIGLVLRVGPFAIYHSGDTVVFDGMAEALRPFNVDLAILPINGKVGNMNGADAARLAKQIGARRVVPCHYDLFEFNTADPNELFVPECERIGQAYKVLRLGERLTLEATR
jgi:L-ascorbate metabolism protein UlaG (beta-lactamase superfamily)